jgi:hypothetical protein
MRDNLLKEKHSGGLDGYFGHDKTYEQLSSSYYWPGMRSDVNNFIDDVESVNMLKESSRTHDCINHFLFQTCRGML